MDKYSVKIQLATALAVIGFIAYWVFIGGGYINKVDANAQDIQDIKPEIRKMPILETQISNMKSDIAEIKNDVKTLLRQR